MPELPDVEAFKATAERAALGRTVARVPVCDAWMLKDCSTRALARRLEGRRIERLERHGKYLFIFTNGGTEAPVLVLHFGMTGEPYAADDDAPVGRWDRLVVTFTDGTQLRYRNPRRLGAIRLLDRVGAAELVWTLGPDPLEAPASWFVEAAPRRRTTIKALLLDQSFLAGVGNEYADEALLAAGIRPDRRANELTTEEARRLYRELRRVLRTGVRDRLAGRIPPRLPLIGGLRHEASRNLARVGDPGVGCPRCARKLDVARVGGRTTFYCPRCQR